MAQVLRRIEWKGAEMLPGGAYSDEDAVVVQMPDGRLLAATVDLFAPVVDDPYRFGRITAANSLSDIYAMGGTPRFALSILGYPPDIYGPEKPSQIIQGGVDAAWEAGVVLGGGHTIKSADVLFGLAVVGDFPEGKVLTKGGALPGDLLYLTKPLGSGILSTAIKRQLLSDEGRTSLTEILSLMNRQAAQAAMAADAHACTDVTGFGFLGHLGEMVKSSGIGVTITAASVPIMNEAIEYAEQDVIPKGSRNNLKFAAGFTRFHESIPPALRSVLADAQTSGGLLVALAPDSAAVFVEQCEASNQFHALVGEFVPGDPIINVL